MVPHWFESDRSGPTPTAAPLSLTAHALRCGSDVAVPFYTVRDDLGEMELFFGQAATLLGQIAAEQRGPGESVSGNVAVQSRFASPLQLEALQKDLALFWLNEKDPTVDWDRLLGYGEFLRHRTYENDPVSVNLIIETGGDSGTIDVTDPGDSQKVLDPLASSPDVCLRVAPDLTLRGYGEVTRDETTEPLRGGYYRAPHFVRSIAADGLAPGEFSFQRTRRGDILIADRTGSVAAWRKGKWYVYAPTLLRDTIFTLYGTNESVADLLVDLFFDLSYKRHGALLIYDPGGTVLESVAASGGNAVLNHADADAVRTALRESVGTIRMASGDHSERGKRRLAEIASMDGAVIFDDDAILAFGAMIPGGTGAAAGARTRATYAARDLGGMAAKVSSDGDVVIPIRLRDSAPEVDLLLRFA